MSSTIDRLMGKKIADRYCITGEIGVGGMGRVFRAMPFDDPSHDVAIKVILRNRQLNSEDLLRFQKEAALMSRLHHPNIICFHELGLLQRSSNNESVQEEFGSGYYIVMEIANGTDLKQSLAKDGRKDLAFFFQVGLSITDALDYTHGKNIIHRDIKPQNIVVGRDLQDQRNLMVKVLDFGVARLAEAMHFTSDEESAGRGYQDIAGTPLYMAPEQTQLMDAPIDHRVDLYSLGCVLYEVLTGRPPFSASTREKLERLHVYEEPEPLSSLRPDVPPIIEKIVHKLLSKHPDDRYQSAFALHSDLLRVKRRLEKRDRPSAISFPLALNDRFKSVSAKLDLIGRENEMGNLIESYEATAHEKGRSRLSVIRGVAGSGKTRLLAEFRNYLAKRKIRFISANFSKHENSLPFNALANGFNDFLIRVLKSQPHEAEELKRKVRALLGPTAHQVAAVVPGLQPFISDDLAAPDELESDFHTFSKAFSDFTRCLSADNQPVVFIFDDLHWADERSLELIDQFFSHNNSQRFFMVIGYRPDDPMVSPRFYGFLEKFSKLRRRYEEFELPPLDLEKIKRITEKMLGGDVQISERFAKYLLERSTGNPLHLVEMVRSLVAKDLIHRSSSESQWQYDEKEIESTTLQFHTIDLVLSRIQDFKENDRAILEVAATVGLTFQFEMLMIERSDTVRVLHVLQRALDEGLISRVPDDADFRHLGKTFSFGHWRARDVIYQNIDPKRRRHLHEAIAHKLEGTMTQRSPRVIFALANHYNLSVAETKARSVELATQCINSNILAGEEAKKAKSWLSAQRYFENVYQQMDFWPNNSAIRKKRAEVVEELADLAAIQRRHGVALKMYSELEKLPIDDVIRASVAVKALNLLLVGGVISKSVATLRNYLRKAGCYIPKGGMIDMISCVFSVMWDLMPVSRKRSRMYKLLRYAYSRHKAEQRSSERRYSYYNLYAFAQQLYFQVNPALAFIFHSYALRSASKGFIATKWSVRLVGERAALFAYLGFKKRCYQFMDLAMDLSKHIKDRSTFGYLSLLRAISVDYLSDKDDEVTTNLRNAFRYIQPEHDRIWYAVALEFRMYRELIKGRLSKVIEYTKVLPTVIPTRNWISPRAMSMAFYAYMLNGSRDLIVQKAEMYLSRREKVHGRVDDLFVRIINTLVTFARGEIEKTRAYYTVAMEEFVKGNGYTFLYPFEEDYVALFAYTFPILFEQEHGRRLMRDDEMSSLYVKLFTRVQKIRGKKRSVTNLVAARSRELLGRKKVKIFYDESLRSAKIGSDQLVLIFTNLWFGNFLVQDGRARKKYLLRAHREAKKLGMMALVEHIERIMAQRGVEFDPVIRPDQPMDYNAKVGSFRSRLTFEHMEHICEVIGLDTAFEQNLDESLAILKRQYDSGRTYVVFSDPESGRPTIYFPFAQPENSEAVLKYVEPYLNIRSTLFLPNTDAPWVVESVTAPAHAASVSDTFRSSKRDLSVTSTHAKQLDATVVIGSHSDVSSADQNDTILHDGMVTVAHTGAVQGAPSRSLKMSALVPLRGHGGSYGVIFLEDVDLTGKDTTDCRNELDVFGSQLGLLVDKKFDRFSNDNEIRSFESVGFDYEPGQYFLEEVSWLKLWTRGRLRSGRETGWYLGLRYGEDHYLLTYCRLNGAQDIRESFSRILWHHLIVSQTLALSSGRNDFHVLEIRDDLASQLSSYNMVRQLEAVSVSFTLFNREKRTASSGHFGPSRPLVLCQDNHVVPENDVVVSLANGRNVRYWGVESVMAGPHVYILPHDSSKLDVSPSGSHKRSLLQSLLDTDVQRELNQILERLVVKENLPRYYVSAIMVEREEDINIERFYDKAE